VDIDLSLAWLPFELESIAAAETVEMQGVSLRIPRPEDLIIYKVVAWRPQDRQDIERLLALHGQQMDLDRVRRLVREIGAALDDSTRAAEFEDLLDRL
jgi:predicted nucleotidyltransferase